VKIRGVRIELEEIESHLRQQPGVREAVVLVQEQVPGDRRLAAYLVVDDQRVPTALELRRSLKEKLPDSMVPTDFVPLDRLPVTPNGKVDRAALSRLRGPRLELTSAVAAPRTEVEQAIAAVWKRVLGIERIGIDDNFFDAGGHSLLLVEVQSGLREVSEREVSIIDLFEYPTIASLARLLTEPPVRTQALDEREDRAAKRKEGKVRLSRELERRKRADGRGRSSD
jgi:hypothetical protein